MLSTTERLRTVDLSAQRASKTTGGSQTAFLIGRTEEHACNERHQ